jgi:PKD repeat protein
LTPLFKGEGCRLRSRLLLLMVLSTFGLSGIAAGVANAATKPIIVPAQTSVSLAPVKVKGYTMTITASSGSAGSLFIFLSRGPQSHTYSFGKTSFSLQISKSLGTGALTAHLGKYGHLALRFTATGGPRASAPGKGCTGPKARTRPLRVVSSSGALVLDSSFFRTVRVGHIKASVSRTGELKCQVVTTPPPGGPSLPRSLSVTAGKLSAFFTAGPHAVTASVTVTSSSSPLVDHTLVLKGPTGNLSIQGDASAASVKSFGGLLTGSGAYTASQYFSGGSSGALTGTLVAHFDSIGSQKVQGTGTEAFLSLPGFNPPPTASFSDSAGPNQGEIDFSDGSFASAGSIVAWAWTFGDNSTSSLQNPTHVYTTSGTYPVTLTVTDNHGHRATVSQNVSVTANKPPTSSFTWDNTSGGNVVNFNDTSIDSDGSVVAWSWTFGDGTSSTQEFPSHTYATSGSYTVTLTVTDNSGAQSSSTQTVTAMP